MNELKTLGTMGAIVMTVALILAVSVVGALSPEHALAVSSNGRPSVTVNPSGTGQLAEYTIGRFKSDKAEYVVGFSMTFPAGFDVSGATLTSQVGTVTVSGQTVTAQLQVPTPIDPASRFTIVLGGITNHSTAGTYNIPSITFQTSAVPTGANPGTSVVTLGVNGDFAITAAPFLSVTIITPGAGQTVDFGNIDPGVATPGTTVSVSVNSNLPYIISRTFAGSQALLGLTVSGAASGAKPAGSGVFSDVFQLLPPWTTDPQVALSASVIYTVTQ